MLAKAARLGAELKFHDLESEKVATLKRQESDIKKLQIIKELAATTAEIEAVAKIKEDDYDRDLPEEDEDPYGQIHEYLQSQLHAIIDDNSSTEAATNPANVVTTVSSEINTRTNVTFASTPRVVPNLQQPPPKSRSGHSLYRRVHSNATYSKFSHYPLRLANERHQSTETDWRREHHYETG